MNDKIPTSRQTALAFLSDLNAGVLATCGHDNMPHASIVHYVTDDSFNLYFLTKIGSKKYESIQAHPQVAFVVGKSEIPQTLQIEGVASEITNDSDKSVHVQALMRVMSQHIPGYVPLAKMDGSMTLMWIQPKWIRWGDFSTETIGNENVFTNISIEGD